jgi:hypothetical protein
LGSYFAGVKAGTLGGLLYIGGLAVFNVLLLYALKADVLASIQQSYAQTCTPVATVNSASIEDCFNSVVAVDVPYVAFVGFFIVLFYSGIFGSYYESFPGRGQLPKAQTAAAIAGLNLVLLGFSGFYFDYEAAVASVAFLVVWTIVFGYFLGRLYRKYTGVVEFKSQDDESLRILVDGHDYTGKARTFALSSSHKLRAEAADDASFKDWVAAGKVSLEDDRSFETLMEVNGDGTISGQVGKKY